jgi:cytochrome bd-type quinol oxidase subunit 2
MLYNSNMNQGSTYFLKFVVVLLGLIVLALCLFVLPVGIQTDRTGEYRNILLGLYVPAVPFFIALYQAITLLNYIEKNRAFTEASVKALKNVKNCAIAISLLFAIGMPYIFYVADKDDAPGVVAVACIIIFASFVIAVASALFQSLFQNAVDIKSENDLTV